MRVRVGIVVVVVVAIAFVNPADMVLFVLGARVVAIAIVKVNYVSGNNTSNV